MRKKLFSGFVLLSGLALLGGCGSDSSSPVTGCDALCAENQEISEFVVSDSCYWLPGDQDYLIYKDGKVTDTQGNEIGSFDASTGTITKIDGTVIENINLDELKELTPEKVENAKNEVEKQKETNPTSSAPTQNPESSGDTPSSNGTTPASSTGTVESSSEAGPVATTGNPEEDIKLYPVPKLKTILGNGTSGWNTRYWDACKPHCSQTSLDGDEGKPKINTQAEYEASHYTARVCNIHDIEIPTFTYSKGLERYWIGIQNTPNACKEADPATGGGFTCTDMAPVAVNDTLAYAFVAGSAQTTSCGKCFHLQYDGSFKDANGNNAAKATHKALKGKHIIVMASNIGHDVKPGQFDLMVPGGGPGIYNALNLMINRTDIEWGAQYGGFLTYCQDGSKCGYDGSLDCYQSCIRDMCDAAFKDSKYPNLLRGCHWFADWYMAADNPTYQWEEVECPQYLVDKYETTISTSIETKILFQSDWSAYKGGDFITTDACSKTPNSTGEYCNPEQLAADKAKTY